MTEEINHCYDGGLYAELVQNRAFCDDPTQPLHWSALGNSKITLDPEQPFNGAIQKSLRVEIPASGGGVANDGYWGFPIQPDTNYHAKIYAKAATGFRGSIVIALESADGAIIYASAELPAVTDEWKPCDVTLKSDRTVKPATEARLTITSQTSGTVWIGFASVFPPTWNDRPNGLRRDLMQMLVDLKPAFLRFPGGNYLEGSTIATRFDWKKTLGPIWERPGHQGPWGYRSSDGLGLLEFLEWSEDIGADPVLAIYAGYSLGGEVVKPGTDLIPFVNDALDEIEYVTGSLDTKWGAQRAKDGHPVPFKLRYVEIGNEDFFDKSGTYDGRFTQFRDAIKEKYPELECISTVGFEQPQKLRVHSRKPDLVDEHYYRKTDQFLKMAPATYETYDRSGPKIFVGEWAAHETSFAPWEKGSEKEPPTPNFFAALGDAAWLAAMERNSDLVIMQCYAPLFVNVNPGAREWRPNLIGYDVLHAYGSPSYYAIAMFSASRGDEILKATFRDSSLQGSVVRDSTTGAIFAKIVNTSDIASPLKIELRGTRQIASQANVVTLAADPRETNTLEDPVKIKPVSSQVSGIASSFQYTFGAHSITVIKLMTQ
jgi:alpha-N-arabinofuranosidase